MFIWQGHLLEAGAVVNERVLRCLMEAEMKQGMSESANKPGRAYFAVIQLFSGYPCLCPHQRVLDKWRLWVIGCREIRDHPKPPLRVHPMRGSAFLLETLVTRRPFMIFLSPNASMFYCHV